MARPAETGNLGEFLAASRAKLTPDDVGLRPGLERRRVPGLRREEIAMLAGVSSSYYTRLEQGQAVRASPQVLDALARALRLTELEHAHLRTLAEACPPVPATGDRPVEEEVNPGLTELLASMTTPALVFDRRRDVLAWNATGHALFAGHLDPGAVGDPRSRPNATEAVFLDAHTRDLYVDWQDKAWASVGHLRALAAQFPHDTRLLEVIGRLTVRSDEFAAMWATHRVRTSASAVYRMRHPLIGRLDVTQQLLTSPDAPGQTIVVCTARPDSSSSAALRLLDQLVHEPDRR